MCEKVSEFSELLNKDDVNDKWKLMVRVHFKIMNVS